MLRSELIELQVSVSGGIGQSFLRAAGSCCHKTGKAWGAQRNSNEPGGICHPPLRNCRLLAMIRTGQLAGVLGSVDGSQITPQCFSVWAGGGFGVHLFVFLDHRAVEGQSRIGT